MKKTDICTFMVLPFLNCCYNEKKKVKVVCGSYSTAALRHIVLLPQWVPSFISRGAAHTKPRDRPLLAKEGTIPGIYLAICNSSKLLSSLTCRKARTWDRFFYFPYGGRHAENFYVRKIQRLRPGLNPQTWVPEASMLTPQTTESVFFNMWATMCF